jgi:SAM-dependent methyltransferase
MRFGGLLENPYFSMVLRDLLDYGRWQGLSKTVAPLDAHSVLDIGCGLGENSRAYPSGYVGIDNSPPRIRFASRRYPASRFILADALRLPFEERSFDLVMLIDTSHHLTDDQFLEILGQMGRVSRRWVLVSDPVLFEGQSVVSRFFYGLDRGAMFRKPDHMKRLLAQQPRLALEKVDMFDTRPGFYRHGVFLLKIR